MQHLKKLFEFVGVLYKSFEDIFAIDMGYGFNSKAEKLKWIRHSAPLLRFNSI